MQQSRPTAYSYNWFIRQFDHAKKQSQILFSTVGDDLLVQKPGADQWSAAECLAHLNAFGNIYYENINRGIEKAQTDAAEEEAIFKPRIFWRGVIRVFEPPYRLKMKTISSFTPQNEENDVNPGEILDQFLELQDRFTDQVERCRQKGINLQSEKVGNPALPFVKMTLGESFVVAEAHQRRHLWQAERVLQKIREAKLGRS